MTFDSPSTIDSITYQMRFSDRGRAVNRAQINQLFNGGPPYSAQEVQENNININVNSLESTRLAHDARSQFYSAFLKPGNYFTASTDTGPVHKRQKWSKIVTKEMNRVMKRHLPYFECMRSKFALNVLHGISPAAFRDDAHWCPEPLGVEDVLIPGGTLLTMYNLPFFAIYHSFTGPELIKLAKGPKSDTAWNQELVDSCMKWLDDETAQLMNNNWPEIWSPEKSEERIKGDGGFYSSDNVPTVNVWDFYFWNDEDGVAGWNRRMILDSWTNPTPSGSMDRKNGKPFDMAREHFLYNPGKRKWADKREEIINWQFADLSSVAPFRYHSVRSLGFLLYSVCHLQNRLRCKFNEAVFEQLMVLMRVKSADDMQRALSVNLMHHGFVDDSIDFIKAQDRYQVNAGLAELGLREGENLINRNAQSNTTRRESGRGSELPTATQWMGEEQKVTQLVSAGLLQAYQYQVPEYREIFRRFCRPNSTDPDVRSFQDRVFKQNVPEKCLNVEAWELEPERVMGAGNKTLEMAIAQQLMQYRNLYDPEPQRQILRDVTLAITDDPARADSLVPEQPMKVSDSVHDAQLSAGVLMLGLPVAIKTGMNHIEYVETLLVSMAIIVQRIQQNGQMPTPEMATPDQLIGLQNMAQHIGQHIELISQDPNEKARVKEYGDQLGKLMNLVKAFAQRLQEQMQAKQAQNGNGEDKELQAKIQAMTITAQAKADNTRSSHAERTAQRQVQFEMEQERKQADHALELQTEAARSHLDLSTTAAKARIELDKEAKKAAKAKSEPPSSE